MFSEDKRGQSHVLPAHLHVYVTTTSYSDNNIWFLLQKIQFGDLVEIQLPLFIKGTWGKNRKHTAMHALPCLVQFGIRLFLKQVRHYDPDQRKPKESLNKFKSLIYRQLCVRRDPCSTTLDFISSGAARGEPILRTLW